MTKIQGFAEQSLSDFGIRYSFVIPHSSFGFRTFLSLLSPFARSLLLCLRRHIRLKQHRAQFTYLLSRLGALYDHVNVMQSFDIGAGDRLLPLIIGKVIAPIA